MVISLNNNLYYGTNGYYQSKYPGILDEIYNKIFATIHVQRDCKRLGGIVRVKGKGEISNVVTTDRLDMFLRVSAPEIDFFDIPLFVNASFVTSGQKFFNFEITFPVGDFALPDESVRPVFVESCISGNTPIFNTFLDSMLIPVVTQNVLNLSIYGGTESTVNAWVQYITTELLEPGY